jgi:2-keto-3-deoxy-L-rhamnonate aldolase RhmA
LQNQINLRWQQIPSPLVSEILCQGNHDGIVLDMEHGFMNVETLVSCIQVIQLAGKKCFVRLSTATVDKIRLCLDNGANGIIFATVESVTRAEKLIKRCNFPDQGGTRGLGLVRQNMWGLKPLISDPPLLIAQIETAKAIESFEELSKCCFNYFMIGPYDLSCSLGNPGNFDTKEYLQAISKFCDLIPENRRAVHIPSDVQNQKKKYNNFGIIASGMDTISLIEKNQEYENC